MCLKLLFLCHGDPWPRTNEEGKYDDWIGASSVDESKVKEDLKECVIEKINYWQQRVPTVDWAESGKDQSDIKSFKQALA